MANNFRYRYGDSRPRHAPWKSGVAIQIGDLSFIDSGDSYKIKPAGSFTWSSAVATPTAPTLTIETGLAVSGLSSGNTGVKVSYQFPWGEGTLSDATVVSVTGANDGIIVAGIDLSAVTYAIGLNIYVETSQGSGTYKFHSYTGGGPLLIVGYGTGRTPPTAVSQSATTITQYGFHQLFCGVSEQAYDGSNANAVGIKDGSIRYSSGGVFEFDTASASYNVGDPVGPAKASGNTLEPQKVALVTHELLGIGRVAEATSSSTKVKVDIFPPRSLSMS